MRRNGGDEFVDRAEGDGVIIEDSAVFERRNVQKVREREDKDARTRGRLADGEYGLEPVNGEARDGFLDSGINGLGSGVDVVEFDVSAANVGDGRVADEGNVRTAVSLDPGRFEFHFNLFLKTSLSMVLTLFVDF